MKPSMSPSSTRLTSPTCFLRAVVLDHLVRMQDVAADLAAEGDVLLLAAELIELRLLLLHLQVVEPRLQHLHRRVAVLVLRSLVLARHDDAGRQVRDADGGVGDVDVLAAGAARAVGVDAEVLVLDLDVDVLGQLRPDEDRGERRVPARRLIERRDAHQPMHAGFGEQQPVGVVAGDRERRALDARPRRPAGSR